MQKIIKRYKEHIILSICSCALLLAPFIATTQASSLLWQESKIPNSLKH